MQRVFVALMTVLLVAANTQLVLADCGCPPVEPAPISDASGPCHVEPAPSVSTCCPVHDVAPAPARFDDDPKPHGDHAAVAATVTVVAAPTAMLASAPPMPSTPPPLERPLYLLDCCFLE